MQLIQNKQRNISWKETALVLHVKHFVILSILQRNFPFGGINADV